MGIEMTNYNTIEWKKSVSEGVFQIENYTSDCGVYEIAVMRDGKYSHSLNRHGRLHCNSITLTECMQEAEWDKAVK